MCRNMNRRIVRHGFTMIELLIVVAILAIAAAIVVPMASSAGSMQLRGRKHGRGRSGVRQEHVDQQGTEVLRRIRQEWWLYYQYRVVDQNENPIRHPITQKSEYVVSFQSDGPLGQIQIAGVNFNGTDKVSFDPLGSPFDGDGDNLNTGVITLRAGGITRTVTVEPVTGYISVSN